METAIKRGKRLPKDETSNFNPDLLLSNAETIVGSCLEKKESKNRVYYNLGQLLLTFRSKVRIEGIVAICKKFNLDVGELTKEVRLQEFDEENEGDVLARRGFTLSQYVGMIDEKKKGYGPKEKNYYNGKYYNKAQDLRMACLYDMLRHLMWKAADCRHDISMMALIERGWEDVES